MATRSHALSPRKGFPKALKKLYDFIEGELGRGDIPNVAGLSVVHEGCGPLRQTKLVLDNVIVSVASVTTGNGVGGTKIFDFPQARVRVLGTVAILSINVAAAKQADFTDATPEGDIGIGTLAPANADALGTDATDDDLATAAAFTMAAYVDEEVKCPSENIITFDGSGTAKDVFLNVLVDAADIDNDVTTEVRVSGTVIITWLNLGAA